MGGGITLHAAAVAELLRAHGYATHAAGKWHLAAMEETNAAGPHADWPAQGLRPPLRFPARRARPADSVVTSAAWRTVVLSWLALPATAEALP